MSCTTGGKHAIRRFLEVDPDGFEQSLRKLRAYVIIVRLAAPFLPSHGTLVLEKGSLARNCPPPGTFALSTAGKAVNWTQPDSCAQDRATASLAFLQRRQTRILEAVPGWRNR